MPLAYFPIKSVIIKGSIKEKLVYNLCPSTEFSEGVWNLSLVSASFSAPVLNENVKAIFSISCNVVKSQKISSSNEVENYNQPLNTVLIDTSVNKNITHFNTHWFYINAISNVVKFYFKNETPQGEQFNAEVYLHVLFQRVI
jgi:hypothetical protein